MNIEQMKAVLREILVKTDLTPCVVGHRGVGKTAGIIQLCRELHTHKLHPKHKVVVTITPPDDTCQVATLGRILSRDKYDAVVLDAIRQISGEAQ